MCSISQLFHSNICTTILVFLYSVVFHSLGSIQVDNRRARPLLSTIEQVVVQSFREWLHCRYTLPELLQWFKYQGFCVIETVSGLQSAVSYSCSAAVYRLHRLYGLNDNARCRQLTVCTCRLVIRQLLCGSHRDSLFRSGSLLDRDCLGLDVANRDLVTHSLIPGG